MSSQVLMRLEPPRRQRLHESLTAQIRRLVSSSKLEIGQRLPSERALAQRLKVSRVVVREALRSLEQSGLVEVRAGARGGAFVTYRLHKPLTDSGRDLLRDGTLTAQHFFEARQAMECFGVGRAAVKATGADIRTLRAINRRLLGDIEDNAKLREHNTAFHVAIAEISGNPLIKLIVQSLLELLDSVYPHSTQPPKFARDTFDRHEAIITAIERRDVALCQSLMAIDAQFTMKLRAKR